jgi:predicted short-subunit dehydrogenase-like oxidoreductase (DUF2520 family)
MDSLCRCQRDSGAGMDETLVIVGPGRLGRSAHRILTEAGQPVVLIGRNDPIPPARLTWLTVPDRAVATVAQAVPSGGIVLHASGALDVDVLRPHPKAGSLHPLMSFPGPELDLPSGTVPAAVAGDEEARIAAHALAERLGFTPFTVSGDRRLYHAAAVIAGNFATTLLVEAGRALSACGVSEAEARRLLAPLATTSLTNTIALGADALTGPVARGDENIIAAHQAALDDLDPTLSALYQALTRATRQVKR